MFMDDIVYYPLAQGGVVVDERNLGQLCYCSRMTFSAVEATDASG